jgi:hypothetical protein
MLDAEVTAATSNIVRIVTMLHDPQSQMLDTLLNALKEGCLCVVDVSKLRGESAFVLSGLILQRIFEHNQEQFTSKERGTIPTLAVVEEAQTVLSDASGASSAMRPYVEWVKEGRKYDLGAVLVTQRPGSISDEILSQGDNWFVFHLLSARDLNALRNANAHFSEDLLSSLLNEPIKGNGLFWSSESDRPYPIPVRVMDFAALYQPRDRTHDAAPPKTWVSTFRVRHPGVVKPEASLAVLEQPQESADQQPTLFDGEAVIPPASDPLKDALAAAIETVHENSDEMQKLKDGHMKWGRLMHLLKDELPQTWQPDKREKVAVGLVKPFMERYFGEENRGWSQGRDASGAYMLKVGP